MKKADLILFAGQSNMQGQTEQLLDADPVQGALEYRFLSNTFVPLRDPVGENITCDGTAGETFCEGSDAAAWLARHALGGACYGHSTMVPAFCRTYAEKTGRTVLAVHAAKGSTQAFQWLPGTDGYAVLLKKAKAALSLAQEQYTVQRVLLVWLQGESDAIYETEKETYMAQLRQLNNALRQQLGLHCFGIIRVGGFTGAPQDAVIQDAQETLCSGDTGFAMLTRLTAELEQDPAMMNPHVYGHFGAAGLARLGAAAAQTLAAL